MHQELLIADMLKFTKNVLFVLTKAASCYGKKCSVSCIFQAITVIVVIKILEKYFLRSFILEMNF